MKLFIVMYSLTASSWFSSKSEANLGKRIIESFHQDSLVSMILCYANSWSNISSVCIADVFNRVKIIIHTTLYRQSPKGLNINTLTFADLYRIRLNIQKGSVGKKCYFYNTTVTIYGKHLYAKTFLFILNGIKFM